MGELRSIQEQEDELFWGYALENTGAKTRRLSENSLPHLQIPCEQSSLPGYISIRTYQTPNHLSPRRVSSHSRITPKTPTRIHTPPSSATNTLHPPTLYPTTQPPATMPPKRAPTAVPSTNTKAVQGRVQSGASGGGRGPARVLRGTYDTWPAKENRSGVQAVGGFWLSCFLLWSFEKGRLGWEGVKLRIRWILEEKRQEEEEEEEVEGRRSRVKKVKVCG